MKEQFINFEQYGFNHTENKPLSREARDVLMHLEETIATPQVTDIGPTTYLNPIYDGETPPLALREYQVYYPQSMIEAYKIACSKYDHSFMKLAAKHKYWVTDYQYAPFTLAFQVDGPAYPEEFLQQAAYINPEVLAEVINARVFEYEANIAAYGLNGRLWPDGTTDQTWHTALENVRLRTGKKVAVLAGSEQKLDEMVLYETGVMRNQALSPETVRSITGFDAFLGPNDLVSIYQQYQGEDCPYVFFGRTSKPKSWLRDPDCYVDEGFLAYPEILRYVRAYALTHNFDDPTLPVNHPSIIMDSKEALVLTGSAYQVTHPGDLYSSSFLKYLAENGIDTKDVTDLSLTQNKKAKLGGLFLNFPAPNLLSESLISHLQARGADSALVASGEQYVRAKPLKQHYGIYGHETGMINRAKFMNELMKQIKIRGSYIIQPEFNNLHIVNSADPNESYVAIDRVFFVRGANGELQPMESCRSLMPAQSLEGKNNNVHEGANTRCAKIVI